MLGDACFVSLTPQLGQSGCLFGGHTGSEVTVLRGYRRVAGLRLHAYRNLVLKMVQPGHAPGVTNAKFTASNPVYIQRVHNRDRDWATPEIWSWPGYSGRQRD
jgi:hypothetical protein